MSSGTFKRFRALHAPGATGTKGGGGGGGSSTPPGKSSESRLVRSSQKRQPESSKNAKLSHPKAVTVPLDDDYSDSQDYTGNASARSSPQTTSHQQGSFDTQPRSVIRRSHRSNASITVGSLKKEQDMQQGKPAWKSVTRKRRTPGLEATMQSGLSEQDELALPLTEVVMPKRKPIGSLDYFSISQWSLEELQKENERLKFQLTREKDEAVQQQQELLKANHDLSRSYTVHRSRIQQITLDMATKDEDLKSNTDEINELKSTIEARRCQVINDKKLFGLEKETLQNHISKLEDDVKTVTVERDSLQLARDDLTTRIVQLTQKNKMFSELVDDSKAREQRTSQQLADSHYAYVQLENKNQLLLNTYDTKARDHDVLENQIEARLRSITSALESEHGEMEALNTRYPNTVEDVTRFTREARACKLEIEGLESGKAELETNNLSLRTDVCDLERKHKQLQSKVEAGKCQLEQVKGELSRARGSCEDMWRECIHWKSRCKTFEQQLDDAQPISNTAERASISMDIAQKLLGEKYRVTLEDLHRQLGPKTGFEIMIAGLRVSRSSSTTATASKRYASTEMLAVEETYRPAFEEMLCDAYEYIEDPLFEITINGRILPRDFRRCPPAHRCSSMAPDPFIVQHAESSRVAVGEQAQVDARNVSCDGSNNRSDTSSLATSVERLEQRESQSLDLSCQDSNMILYSPIQDLPTESDSAAQPELTTPRVPTESGEILASSLLKRRREVEATCSVQTSKHPRVPDPRENFAGDRSHRSSCHQNNLEQHDGYRGHS